MILWPNLTVSMVRPQKCMKPPTSTSERKTQPRTRSEAAKSVIRKSVVTKTHAKASRMFLKQFLKMIFGKIYGVSSGI